MLSRMKIPNRRSFIGTRRFVVLVVRPRPDTRTIRRHTLKSRRQNVKQTRPHKSFNTRRMQQGLQCSRLRVRGSASSGSFCDPMIDISPRHFPPNATGPRSKLEPGLLEDHDINPESESTTTGSTALQLCDSFPPHDFGPEQTRILRSSRSRKCKSIYDTRNELLKLKDPMPISNTWPRTKCESLDQRLRDMDCGFAFPPHPLSSSSTTSVVWYDCSESTRRTGDSEYLTVPSYLDEGRSADGSTLTNTSVVEDLGSSRGVFAERIRRVHPNGIYAQAPSGFDPVDIQRSIQPVLAVPSLFDSSEGLAMQSHEARSNDLYPSRPILTLTLPTPAPPQSPLFVPQSPITVSKFFTAATSPNHQFIDPFTPRHPSTSTAHAPSFPICDNCTYNLGAFDYGALCHECNDRWLACKVWYRATDGGRRRWLTEPYVRPGECNETNRTILRDLGSGLGFGIGLGPANMIGLEGHHRDTSARRKTRHAEDFWRACTRSVRMKKFKFRVLRRRLISTTRRTLGHHISKLKPSLVALA